MNFVAFTMISISLEFHESIMTKHDTFCLFCKMVINKTVMIAISLCNISGPYEFNSSIDFWLKTTSHVDVIAPSTVSTIQNVKLLPSPNLWHSLMLCHVTRSQGVGCVKHFGDPPVLVKPSRLRRNRRSCRKWIRRDPTNVFHVLVLYFLLDLFGCVCRLSWAHICCWCFSCRYIESGSFPFHVFP